jgi:TRAP-type C4-dicarboxylate transport system permease small subunit
MGAAPPTRPRDGFLWRPVKGLVLVFAALAAVGVLAMVAVTCVDVALRLLGRPLVGAYDLVRIAGGVTLACALPVTTAVKGHVAIEYFFHKLRRPGRIVVDTLMRLLQMTAFAVAARECARHGWKLLRSGEVTPTLQWPVFWVAWVLAAACGLTVLVTLYHLVHPGREMIRT